MEDAAVRATIELAERDAFLVTWLCRRPARRVDLGGFDDPETARSLRELARVGATVQMYLLESLRPVVRRHMGPAGAAPIDATAIRTFGDHAAYYIPPGRAQSAFRFLRCNDLPLVRLEQLTCNGRSDLEDLGKELQSAGHRVAIVDVTSPDLRAGPLRVVRALATKLVPLHCGWNLERSGSRRLAAMGGAVNRDPHPLC